MIGELAALGAALSWAIAPLLYLKALVGTKPVLANIVRVLTNGVVLVVVLLVLGGVEVLAELPLWILVVTIASGIVGLGVGDTLYMFGLKTLGVSRAVPLAATYPLFSLLWAVAFLGQPWSGAAVSGAIFIVFGIWLLSRQKAEIVSNATRKAVIFGVGMSLATAVVWSIGVTLMDIAVSNAAMTSLQADYALVTLRVVSMSIFFAILLPFVDKNRSFMKMNRKTVIQLCIGGLIANGLGWFLLNYSFLSVAEAQAVPISSVSPLFAAFAGMFLFHEKASFEHVLGALVIVVGVSLIFVA
jgi:drug/metabolite transporter (DMT)-like permease